MNVRCTKLLGKYIKRLRLKRGLNLYTVAHMIGITYQMLSLIELGKVSVNYHNMWNLAQIYGVSINDLYKSMQLKTLYKEKIK